MYWLSYRFELKCVVLHNRICFERPLVEKNGVTPSNVNITRLYVNDDVIKSNWRPIDVTIVRTVPELLTNQLH